MTHHRRAPAARWLAWGDAVCLIAFTVIGLRFHRIALTPFEVLQTAVPLLATWFAATRLLGTYRRGGGAAFLLAWVAAVPAALAIRQLWLGRPLGPGFLVFLAVGGALTLVFLIAWRALALVVTLFLTMRWKVGPPS